MQGMLAETEPICSRSMKKWKLVLSSDFYDASNLKTTVGDTIGLCKSKNTSLCLVLSIK